MFSSHFYHSTFKNAIKIFGKLFSNIRIKKGEEFITVPISYSGKDKIIQKYEQNVSLNNKDEITITLPRLGFLMGDPQIDKAKQLNRLHRLHPLGSKEKTPSSFNSIPYTIPFYLSIITKTSDEMFQIVEQIIPFFSPEFVVTVDDIPQLNLHTDYVYKLDSVAQESNSWDGVFDERRLIIWNISFLCECSIYYPLVDSKLIKKMIIQGFQDDSLENDIFSFTSEVLPFEANADDVHVIKDVWQDEMEEPSIQFLSESYEIFVTNFKNVVKKDFEDQGKMDEVWAIIQDLLNVINSDKQIQSLVSFRGMNTLSSSVKTLYETSLDLFIPLKDETELNSIIKVKRDEVAASCKVKEYSEISIGLDCIP